MGHHTWDVAILGAGIAGSSVAKSLADKGWETLIIDRQSFPRHKVCGEFLSPESEQMLSALGLMDTINDLHPRHIERARIIMSHGRPLDIPLPGTAFGISRFALDAALHSAVRLAGVHVQTETMVTSVNRTDSGYWIEMKQGNERQSCHARAVIAAWGANGRPKHQGSPLKASTKRTYTGVKSHYEGIKLDAVVELYFFKGGYLGLSPIENGRVNVAALFEHKSLQSSEKSILGILKTAARMNPQLEQRLACSTPIDGTQAAVAPIILSRKPVVWDEYPHIGDAALMIPPLCGDGMSMALRSGKVCGELADYYLRGKISLDGWEAEYGRFIKQQFKGPVQWGRRMQGLISIPLLSQLLLTLGHLSPQLAYKLVQVTRLKEFDLQNGYNQ